SAGAEVFLIAGESKISLRTVERTTAGANENVNLGKTVFTIPDDAPDRIHLVVSADDPAFTSSYTLFLCNTCPAQ
ncbi:MAG: hypothetical protein IKY02_02715, partial [Lachnospiraceae bacterium]|nr:hypothetical protein [Lachnospiraceae bacterium]